MAGMEGGGRAVRPVKPLAVRYTDARRTVRPAVHLYCIVLYCAVHLYCAAQLKLYKEQLRVKTKRSRLLIIAIAEKLAEKEREMVQVRLMAVQVKVQLLERFLAKRRIVIVVLSSLSVDQTAVNCGFCDN